MQIYYYFFVGDQHPTQAKQWCLQPGTGFQHYILEQGIGGLVQMMTSLPCHVMRISLVWLVWLSLIRHISGCLNIYSCCWECGSAVGKSKTIRWSTIILFARVIALSFFAQRGVGKGKTTVVTLFFLPGVVVRGKGEGVHWP